MEITGNGGDDVRQVNKEGFSLVEMLIAMTITVFVMAGIITLLAYGTRSMGNTQARAALQDQAKDSVNHISTSILEGAEVYWDDAETTGVHGDGTDTTGILLIGNVTKELKNTGDWDSKYEWAVYWRAPDPDAEAASPGKDLVCFIRVEDLVKETSALPADFDSKEAAARFADLVSRLKLLEAKEHLLCDDIKDFSCNEDVKKDAEGKQVGRASWHITLELADDKSEFKCEKDITMRNQ